ncbi:unnamed protein product, partial [Closterium sp. NIES-53]
DHFLSLDPTSLTVDLLEQHLFAAETSAVALGAGRGTPRPPFFEGCSPSPLAPSYAATDVPGAEDVRAASASAKRRSGKGKGSKGGGGGSGSGGGGRSGGGGGSGGGGSGGSGGGGGGVGGGGRGSSGSGNSGGGGTGARRGGPSDLLRSGIAIFDLDFDAILSAMYALSISAEGDCYRCVPPDPGIAAAALGASESGSLSGTAPAQALHTLTLDSGASRCFFRDSTTLTPLPAPIPVRLAGPSGGPVVARSSTVLPCPAVPSGSLSGSSLYTLATEPPQEAASAQVSASGQVAASCSCRLLSHQTLLWHHRLGHPSLPRLHGMHSRLLSGLPSSLPPLPPSPGPPCLPCVEGRQRAAPHSSSFPPTTAPLQTLHMDVGGEFSSNLLRDFCHGEGILQSFTLPDSPQQNGIAERRIGLVMEVGDAWVFRVWGSHAFVHDTSADKLSARAIPCVFLGFVRDAPNWQFYHPTSRRVLLSQDVTFNKSVPFYLLFPYHSAPPPPPPLFLAPGPPPVDPLPPQGPASSGVSQVDPLPGTAPVKVAVGSGAAPGAASWGAESGGAEPEGAGSEGAGFGGAEPESVEPGGAESEGVGSGGAEPRGAALSGGPAGASLRLSPQQLREWLVRRARLRSGAHGAGGAGDAGAGGAGVTARAGGPRGTAADGPRGARTRGTGAAGTGGVGGAGAGDPMELSAAGAGGSCAGGAGAGGAGAGGAGVGCTGAGGARAAGAGAVDLGAGGAGGTMRPQPYFVPLLQQVLGVPSSSRLTPPFLCPPPDQSQPPLQPASPLPAPSPYAEQFGGLTERREPASRHVSPVRTAPRAPRSRPPPVPGMHTMALRPSFVPLRVPLPSPPKSSLSEVPDPDSDRARAANPTISRLLATAVTDPSFESAVASALVAELLYFAAACRLDYATALIAESASSSPPYIGGECALGTDVVEDSHEDFKCLAAAVPCFASMLLAPEGDPDAPDIPTLRSYAEAITGPYSSQWQAAMDAEMASWNSTGTYVDKVPLSRTNIVDGMWIFRVKRPPGSPPTFKARYVARGFRQRQGVDYFQNFYPTPKMTTLWVLLHVAAQHDYELHSLDFSTAFLQGSLHEEIWLR